MVLQWATAVGRSAGCMHGGGEDVNVNVNNLLAISKSDFDNSGEPGPQAEGVNHLETPLRQLQVTHRASSCAKRGGHVQLCSKPRGAHGIDPKTFRRRGQLLSRPPTTGRRPVDVQYVCCQSSSRVAHHDINPAAAKTLPYACAGHST